MKLIVLGECCAITLQLRKLGLHGRSSMLEWMRSEKFGDVVRIVEKVIRSEHVEIVPYTKMPSNVSIGGTDIYTSHWLQNNEIREVFDRRAARFLSDLKETEPVLFIRDNRTAEIMVDDIEKFKGLIDSVNKDCNYCILLLTPPGVTKIRVPKVVHVETRQEDTIISEAIRLCKIQLTGM